MIIGYETATIMELRSFIYNTINVTDNQHLCSVSRRKLNIPVHGFFAAPGLSQSLDR